MCTPAGLLSAAAPTCAASVVRLLGGPTTDDVRPDTPARRLLVNNENVVICARVPCVPGRRPAAGGMRKRTQPRRRRRWRRRRICQKCVLVGSRVRIAEVPLCRATAMAEAALVSAVLRPRRAAVHQGRGLYTVAAPRPRPAATAVVAGRHRTAVTALWQHLPPATRMCILVLRSIARPAALLPRVVHSVAAVFVLLPRRRSRWPLAVGSPVVAIVVQRLWHDWRLHVVPAVIVNQHRRRRRSAAAARSTAHREHLLCCLPSIVARLFPRTRAQRRVSSAGKHVGRRRGPALWSACTRLRGRRRRACRPWHTLGPPLRQPVVSNIPAVHAALPVCGADGQKSW